ncbi:hypothetical protein ARMGADRAFT_32317 [Armillaria gallica]|uniref:Uncharacterized protein n=1 Tax=Armillaria gallica TaxID=47427 RepID=A0A2H3ETN9_ARMGA|nr:hypothetical protein ARMGADRAFT_32317 [Armillaria gallica]
MLGRIMWLAPTGPVVTPSVRLRRATKLAGVIHPASIYQRRLLGTTRRAISFSDMYIPSISRSACAISWTQLSLWLIEPPTILLCGIYNFKGKSYTNGRTVFVGEPWSRQTAIYKFENNDVVTMIKDQFEHVDRRFQESELYRKLEGAAGWVTLVDSCDVGLTTGSDASARVKKRLLMSSGGEAWIKSQLQRCF